MRSTANGSSQRYFGVVFKHAPPTPDFSCSQEVLLAGEHDAAGAWAAVAAALKDPACIGGEIRPVVLCGNERGKGCGNALPNA